MALAWVARVERKFFKAEVNGEPMQKPPP